jgi:hypothetical protein
MWGWRAWSLSLSRRASEPALSTFVEEDSTKNYKTAPNDAFLIELRRFEDVHG